MKQMIFIFVLGVFLAGVIYAAGEYMGYNYTYGFEVVTDSTGDSTYASTNAIHVGSIYGYKTLHSRIIVGDPTPSLRGIGLDDSAWIRLYTTWGEESILIDSGSKGGLPCTLSTTIHSNVGDSLLRDGLTIGVTVFDSLGDSAFTATYPVKYDINLK